MVNLGELIFSIIAKDEASEPVNKMARNIGSAGTKAGLALTGVGLSSKLMADNISSTSVPFDQALKGIKSIGTSDAEIDLISDSALNLSKQFPAGAQAIVDSAYLIKSAGFTDLPIEDYLNAITKTAVAGGEDVQNVTGTVITALGANYRDVGEITSSLATGVKLGKYEMGAFGQQMQKNIATGSNLGLSIQEVAAANVVLQNSFSGPEEAGTGLNTMLTRLVDPAVIAKMNAMGVTVTDSEGNFIGLGNVVEQLKTQLPTLGGEVVQQGKLFELFGAHGVKAAMGLIGSSDAYADYTTQMSDSTAVGSMLDAQMESTASKLEIAKNKTDAAKISLGAAMAPAEEFVAMLTGGFASAIEALPGPIQTLVGVGLQFGQVFLLIGPLLMGISAAIPLVASALTSVGFPATLGGLGAALTAVGTTVLAFAATFALPIVAIVAVGAAIYLLNERFNFIGGIIDWLSGLWKGFGDWLGNTFGPIIEGISGFIGELFGGMGEGQGPIETVLAAFKSLGDIIGKVGGAIGSVLGPAIKGVATWIGSTFGPAIKFVVDILKQLAGAYIAQVARNFEMLWGVLKAVASWLVGVFGPAVEKGIGILATVWDGIKGAVSSAWSWITDTISSAWKAVVGIFTDRHDIVGTIGKIWTGVRDGVASAWSAITSAVSAAWKAVVDLFTGKTDIIAAIGRIWEGIRDGVASAWSGIQQRLAEVWTTIRDAAATAWEGIKQAVWDALSNLATGFANLGPNIIRALGAVWEGVKSAAGTAWQGIVDYIKSYLQIIVDLFTGKLSLAEAVGAMWNLVKEKTGEAWDAIVGVIKEKFGGLLAIFTDNPVVQAIAGTLGEIGKAIGIVGENADAAAEPVGRFGDAHAAMAENLPDIKQPLKDVEDGADGVGRATGDAKPKIDGMNDSLADTEENAKGAARELSKVQKYAREWQGIGDFSMYMAEGQTSMPDPGQFPGGTSNVGYQNELWSSYQTLWKTQEQNQPMQRATADQIAAIDEADRAYREGTQKAADSIDKNTGQLHSMAGAKEDEEWAGQNDPEYTGGDPNAGRNDPRIRGDSSSDDAPGKVDHSTAPVFADFEKEADGVAKYQAAYASWLATISGTPTVVAPAAEANTNLAGSVDTVDVEVTAATPTIRQSVGAYTDLRQAADPVGPVIATVGTAFSTVASSAIAANPAIAALEQSTINSGLAALGAAPAFTATGTSLVATAASAMTTTTSVNGTTTAVTTAGGAAAGYAQKLSAAEQAYAQAKQAADQANTKLAESKTRFDQASTAANATQGSINAASRAYDAAKRAADAANTALNASSRELLLARERATLLTGTLSGTTGTLNAVAGAANAVAGSFTSMGKTYLTARNSIQSNPITSVQIIKRIVEGGGANVAPGPAATKYYPTFHSGGTFNAGGSSSEGMATLLNGERVLSPGETKEYDAGLLTTLKAIATKLLGSESGGAQVNIDKVELSNDYPFDKMMDDVRKDFARTREARGMRSPFGGI